MSAEELSAVDWVRLVVGCARLLRLVKVGEARLVKEAGCGRLFRFALLIITGSWAASLCRASSLVRVVIMINFSYSKSD